jgi:hypothetical protein
MLMTENHDEIIDLIENGILEFKIKLDLNSPLDVALKNYLLVHRAASSIGMITYEQMWEQVENSVEIHQATLYVMRQLFDLAKAVGDEQNTDKK